MKCFFPLLLQCQALYDGKFIFSTYLRVSCCSCCSRTETNVSFLLVKRCHTSSSVCTFWDEELSKQLAISFAVAITALCPNPVQCVGGVATNFLYRDTYLIYSKSRGSSPGCFILILQCSDQLNWGPHYQRHIWFCLINTRSFFFFSSTSHINKIQVVKNLRLLAQSESDWRRVRKSWDKHVRCSLTHLASCIFRCADAHVYLWQAGWHEVGCPESPVSVTVWRLLGLAHSWEALCFVLYLCALSIEIMNFFGAIYPLAWHESPGLRQSRQ